MIDLDKYLKQGVEIKLNGEVIEVLQPTAGTAKEIGKMENEITDENALDIRSKTTLLILNNNSSGKKFTREEVDQLPYKLQDLIIQEVVKMVYKAENDPN